MIITCEQLVEAATDAREGHLGRLDDLTYRAHLAWCKHCRTYVAQLDTVVASLETLGTTEGPPEAPRELRDAVTAHLRRRRST